MIIKMEEVVVSLTAASFFVLQTMDMFTSIKKM